jgi:hypothetical protein
MLAVADQLALVSTFLGGVSATILITVVIFSSTKKSTSVLVAFSSAAACCLLLAVISAWRLTIALHPDIPVMVTDGKIMVLWRLMIIAYIIGFVSLISALGASGWIKSKPMGLFTTATAAVTLILFVVTSTFIQ